MDESLFIRELNIKSPLLKVLDFLMDNESFDYSKTDIAEGCGLSRTTLFKVWPRLEALELITATRTMGQAKMYRLNKQNLIAKKLMEWMMPSQSTLPKSTMLWGRIMDTCKKFKYQTEIILFEWLPH